MKLLSNLQLWLGSYKCNDREELKRKGKFKIFSEGQIKEAGSGNGGGFPHTPTPDLLPGGLMSTQPLPDTLPTRPDDPRLDHWYHTIELGNGLVSRGVYDHRSVVDCYGLPRSLAGKTVLDVATADGFFAFEMERRGADEVVAIDVARYGDFDWLPRIKAKLGTAADGQSRFAIAHALRGSRVKYRICNVYDLSPESVGRFDIVFCGSLLLHLQNPLKALCNILAVTKEKAIIETMIDVELDKQHPDRPLISFGHRTCEAELGEACIYWTFNTRGLQEILAYAGFVQTRPLPPFSLPPVGPKVCTVLAYPA